MTAETFFANFGHLADAQSGVKKLRELILQLAVQGKLVPQNLADQPARELLKEIKSEIAVQVEQRVINTPKNLSKIKSEEVPFGLPVGWEWTRLGEIGVTNIGLTYSPSDVSDIGIPVLRSNNIQEGKLDLSDLKRVKKDVKKSLMVNEGDLLICARNGSRRLVGKTALITGLSEEMAFGAFMAIFRSRINKYLLYFINSPLFRNMIDEVNTVTINQITQNNLRSTIFPLPPLEEQKRIVAKVDQLMPLCDELEARQQKQQQGRKRLNNSALDALLTVRKPDEFASHWQRICNNFDLLYDHPETIAKLRAAILQLAVQGRLVPQDPNDETASFLLERVKIEKERLVQEKKIKPPKPLPEIQAEDLPYALPRGWEWVHLGALNEFINGDRSKKYPNRREYVSEGIPWINTGHIEPDGSLTQRNMNFISREKFDSLGSGKIMSGDLLYCLRGATFGKTAIVDPYDEGAIASSLMIIRPYAPCFNQYLYHYLISPVGRSQIFRFDNGSAQPNLSANSVRKYVYPLPPLAEQERIVTKVNQLMALCDELEAKLNQAQQHSENLMTATVRQILVA